MDYLMQPREEKYYIIHVDGSRCAHMPQVEVETNHKYSPV